MKIAYLSTSGQLGGAERVLLDTLATLRIEQPDWRLQLVTPAAGPLLSKATELGVSAMVLPFPSALACLGDAAGGSMATNRVGRTALLWGLLAAGSAVPWYIKQLRRVLLDMNPDLLHTNGFKMHILGIWSRPRGIPVLWHVHDYASSRPLMALLLRHHAARCSAIVANSNSVAEDLRSLLGHEVRVYSVYNGIDLQCFSPTGPSLDLDRLAGLPPAEPGTLKVGLMGTTAFWKGHKVFLKALSMLPPGLRVRGYIIGGALYQTDGSQYSLDEFRRFAGELGILEKVGFTGYVEDAAAALRSLDIVVHASTAPEPFGLVIAEAMACGRAVIASLAGGAEEIISQGLDALGHPPGDAISLAQRISQLVTDAELRVRLGAAARATSERCYDRDRLAAELIPIYRRISLAAA